MKRFSRVLFWVCYTTLTALALAGIWDIRAQ